MQRHGYRTAVVGKWHLKADPAELARLKRVLLEKKKAVGDEDERYPVLMAQRERYW